MEPSALSIEGFCRDNNISRSMYYKMRNLGLGPREMQVGTRRLISKESAANWRRQREIPAPADQQRDQ